MTSLCNRLSSVFLAGLVIVLGAYSHAAAQALPVCSWPFESTGQGITNVATPDTNATYWIMPFDTKSWAAMVIKGQYPKARFFNFDTYTATGAAVDSVVDKDLAPDPGSTNPFATTADSKPQSYTVMISGNATGSANSVRVGASRLAFVVYRVYAPNLGLDRTGGVGLPTVSLVAQSGEVRTLRPCPFASAETGLTNLILLLRANRFVEAANFLQQIFLNTDQTNMVFCNPSQPGPGPVAFAPATLGANFFSNPQTTYLETPGICFQQGKVLVVRGKALVFPNSYLTGSVLQPAFDTQIQARYWSMCNNDRVIPYPVVACLADFETVLDENQFYTYVISGDQAPPSWLPPGVNWLPWGETDIPKNLIFRIILPVSSALEGADYTPKAAFCDTAVVMQQGWQSCFAPGGVM